MLCTSLDRASDKACYFKACFAGAGRGFSSSLVSDTTHPTSQQEGNLSAADQFPLSVVDWISLCTLWFFCACAMQCSPLLRGIEFKVLTMVLKLLHNQRPTFIRDLLELKKSNYSLRSVNGINLQEQRSKLKQYGDRAFSVSAPQLWNRLPDNVKASPTLDIFKKNLKTH